jgi:hypothetical protein
MKMLTSSLYYCNRIKMIKRVNPKRNSNCSRSTLITMRMPTPTCQFKFPTAKAIRQIQCIFQQGGHHLHKNPSKGIIDLSSDAIAGPRPTANSDNNQQHLSAINKLRTGHSAMKRPNAIDA